MAFHQPTRQAMQRVPRPTTDDRRGPSLHAPLVQEQQPEESQTWVLFSPGTDITTTSYLAETEQSLETPGRSRLSDIGSLPNAAGANRHASAAYADSHSAIDEDGELDSLDSHLPDFRSIPGVLSQSPHDTHDTGAVFPSHDGLGSFRLDQPAIGAEAQDHLYQFEKFNPRRTRRRRESAENPQPMLSSEAVQEQEKRRRIEDWRLDHSKHLLDEIQKETRRRRKLISSTKRQTSKVAERTSKQQDDVEDDNLTWHDEEADVEEGPGKSILSRLTCTFIKDILGIDDRMLSILTGETTVDVEEELSSTPRASQSIGERVGKDDGSRQLQMLERVSHELGILVEHLTRHPGGFSSYTRMQNMPIPYAGLPVIPETNGPSVEVDDARSQPTQPDMPEFRPTLAQAAPASINRKTSEEDVQMGNTFTKEEWEKDLDIPAVFRYLRARFGSRNTNTSPSPSTHNLANSNMQDSAAKIARIRQHHPLISRARPAAERRAFRSVVGGGVAAPSSPVALRHQSSCASQSTRRSARRSSVSSRHYWDIGGSLGTGSMIASNGPMGSWGEV